MRESREKQGVAKEVKNIREYAEKAGIGLADIGTSEEELRTCLKTGNMNAAKTWLKRAREGSVPREVDTRGHIRRLAVEANFTLADIGTSEEELQRLHEKAGREAKKASKEVAKEVGRLRQEASDWWYLLPLFFGVLGGIIAWLVNRRLDEDKSGNFFWAGVGITALGLMLNFFI